jgi:DNA-binding MarR family transcriptional regulator
MRKQNRSVNIDVVARQTVMTTNAPPARRAPAALEDILELETFFSFRVSIVAKLLDRRLSHLVGDRFGLAVAEYRVLAQITVFPKSTVRAISSRTFVDKAQVSRAVAVLEQQDLIARATPSNDRRSPVFTATRAGKALMNRIIPMRRNQEAELVAHLGKARADALTESLKVLMDWLAEPMPDGDGEPTANQRRQAIRNERVARTKR